MQRRLSRTPSINPTAGCASLLPPYGLYAVHDQAPHVSFRFKGKAGMRMVWANFAACRAGAAAQRRIPPSPSTNPKAGCASLLPPYGLYVVHDQAPDVSFLFKGKAGMGMVRANFAACRAGAAAQRRIPPSPFMNPKAGYASLLPPYGAAKPLIRCSRQASWREEKCEVVVLRGSTTLPPRSGNPSARGGAARLRLRVSRRPSPAA